MFGGGGGGGDGRLCKRDFVFLLWLNPTCQPKELIPHLTEVNKV